jgi:hypothetical protein
MGSEARPMVYRFLGVLKKSWWLIGCGVLAFAVSVRADLRTTQIRAPRAQVHTTTGRK